MSRVELICRRAATAYRAAHKSQLRSAGAAPGRCSSNVYRDPGPSGTLGGADGRPTCI
jgi:hypothetical protein